MNCFMFVFIPFNFSMFLSNFWFLIGIGSNGVPRGIFNIQQRQTIRQKINQFILLLPRRISVIDFLITVFNKNLITPLISVMVNAKFDYDIMKFKIRQYLNMNGVIIDE